MMRLTCDRDGAEDGCLQLHTPVHEDLAAEVQEGEQVRKKSQVVHSVKQMHAFSSQESQIKAGS